MTRLLNWKQERGAVIPKDKALHLTSSSVPFVTGKEVIWTKQGGFLLFFPSLIAILFFIPVTDNIDR
jgi:hypothetical protein